MNNRHKKPTIWNEIYSKTDRESIQKSLKYGLKNKETFQKYYAWLDILIQNKIKIKKSLEVGSGTGGYSFILKKLGIVNEVYLLDYSKESLKIAKESFKKNNLKGNFIEGNAFNLPFKNKEFDLVLSGGLLEHFGEENMIKILKEQKRVSKYILTQVPVNNVPYWIMRIIITLIKRGWPFGFEKPISIKKNLKLYKRLGIKIIDVNYHDILTSIKYNYGSKKNLDLNFEKSFLNKIFRNEIAILGKTNN